jgi:NitT/TauT family transport system permease protein
LSRPATLARATILVAATLLLEALCRSGAIAPVSLVAPSRMVARLAQLVQEREFWEQTQTTLASIAIAVAAAIVAGFAGGAILHALPRLRRAMEPLIASYYALPFFVLYPLTIVIFGMNDVPIIIMGYVYGVVAMVSATLSGLDRIPAVLRKVGRSYRMGALSTALLIQLPATGPHLFTGAKLALGYGVAGVIGAEFILSGGGLGYAIAYAYNNLDNETMYATLLFVLLLVAAILAAMNWLERRIEFRAGAGWTIALAPLPAAGALERVASAAAVALALVTAWYLLHLLVGSEALASPGATLDRAIRLVQSDRFWMHAAETLRALGLAVLIACLMGGLIGIALGASRRAGEIAAPMIVALQATPKVTLYPVILLFFGLGIAAKVAFGVIHGFIPMALVTLNAVRSINPALLRTARALRLGRVETMVRVMIPATIPELVTAIRLSFSITFLGVMVGEMFASQRGLGYLVMNGIAINDVSAMMAITVMIGVFALAINVALLALDKHVHRR